MHIENPDDLRVKKMFIFISSRANPAGGQARPRKRQDVSIVSRVSRVSRLANYTGNQDLDSQAPNSVQAQLRYRTNNNSITIIGYTGTKGDVTIPGTVNGYPVVSIGDSAFQNSVVLTNVTISSGVTYLGM